MKWKQLGLLFLILLAVGLVACDGAGEEEAATNESALAADEPGAQAAERDPAQIEVDDDNGDEDVVITEDCTYSQGYWKNHPDAWNVEELTLGDVTYDRDELLSILETAPQADATYILVHQLIAAELNMANDAEGI